MKKIACIVRRPDILHVLGLASSIKDSEQVWIIVYNLKNQDEEMVTATREFLDILGKNYLLLKDYEVIRLLKSEHFDYAIRQNQWADWGRLKSLHKYVKTLFTDYVTVSNAMNCQKHELWSIGNNYYVNNCHASFVFNSELTRENLPDNVYNSKSYKAYGISLVPGIWVGETDRFKILLEFHLLLGKGDLLPTAILDIQYDRVIRFIDNNYGSSIIINLHPDLWNKSRWLVDKLIDDISIRPHVTVSKLPMHCLAKEADLIISDGISLLYESDIVGTQCVYVKDPKYDKLFSDDYSFLVDTMMTVPYIDEINIHDVYKDPNSAKIKEFLLSGKDVAKEIL